MTSALLAALGIDKENIDGRFVAVKECHGSNANFVLTTLMVDCLNKNRGMCLVTLHNAFSHYHNVLTKLGYSNIREMKEKGQQLEVLELFLAAGSIFDDERNNILDSELNELWDEDGTLSMKFLYLLIKKKVGSLLTKQSNVCIIIDDVSHFIDLGVSEKEVLNFIQYCRTFLTSLTGTSLVILTHLHKHNEASSIIATYLSHVADLCVQVSLLKTGRCSDVSGILKVKNKYAESGVSQQWNNLSTYLFKLSDRHIKLNAPGTLFQS